MTLPFFFILSEDKTGQPRGLPLHWELLSVNSNPFRLPNTREMLNNPTGHRFIINYGSEIITNMLYVTMTN